MYVNYSRMCHQFGTKFSIFFIIILLNKFFLTEALFGVAPFASRSFAELEMKIRSTDPVTVCEEM